MGNFQILVALDGTNESYLPKYAIRDFMMIRNIEESEAFRYMRDGVEVVFMISDPDKPGLVFESNPTYFRPKG